MGLCVNTLNKELKCLETMINSASKQDYKAVKSWLNDDALDVINKNKLAGVEHDAPKCFSESFKKVVGKFFSINEKWSWKRNLFGAFLVYCPEIPAYFIPSYTQSKKTGTAKDLKHGEGIRGLVTGGLEGLAVGAIVSGKEMTTGKIAPYFVLGAVLQFMSSLILPKVGEKVGTFVYNKRKYAEKLEEIIDIPFGNEPTPEQLTALQKPQTPAQLSAPQKTQSPQKPQAPNASQAQFKGAVPYNQFNRGNLKV